MRAGEAPEEFDLAAAYQFFFYNVFVKRMKISLAKESLVLSDTADGVFTYQWFRGFAKDLGLDTGTSGSSEAKLVSEQDALNYQNDVQKNITQHKIRPDLMLTYDEFNDFMYVKLRKVVTAPSEKGIRFDGASDRIRGVRCPVRKKQRRCNAAPPGTRKSITGALVYAPLTKGKIMLMVKECPKDTAEMIRRDFGHWLVLIVNQTGNVHGNSHVNHVLPHVIAPSLKHMRQVRCVGNETKAFYNELVAPHHVSDECAVTKATGLK